MKSNIILTEKEYRENYEIFKSSNNRVKEIMLNNGLIDVQSIINNVPKGTTNEIYKGK